MIGLKSRPNSASPIPRQLTITHDLSTNGSLHLISSEQPEIQIEMENSILILYSKLNCPAFTLIQLSMCKVSCSNHLMCFNFS